jgi:hypothetical protein
VAGLDGDFRAAPDAGSADAATDGPSGCVLATYPDPPGGADDGTDIGTVGVAVHTIDLGDMADTPGYDLDHTCTCTADAGPTCAGYSSSASTYCDAPGGVDNQFAKLVSLIQLAVGVANIGSTALSNKADAGYWTLLVEIKGYNGQADDPAVDVALYPCASLGTQPKWDGTDSWPILATSVNAAGDPLYASQGAYVASHTLVATVPSVPLILAGEKQTITLTLRSAVLTGQLVQSHGQWRLVQGVIAARLGTSDFFQSLSSYRDTSAQPLCTDSAFFKAAKMAVCNDADILLDENQPRTTPCDAFSFGMGFSADSALLGPKVPVPTPTPGCPAATDPAGTTCP